ncbi:MAG: hypothetical protein IKU11_09680 [Clostridia bacterium]|nr:hypothetical protein [Clostridia bacterium]
MYGYKDVYFNREHPGFRNSIWIELVGFDNTLPDYGVDDFLSKTGFRPHMVSFHLTSISFVMMHRGMREEYRLPAFACSYSGHDGNDDRHRQDWTNLQMAGLVKALHARGVEVYISMFDFDSETLVPGVERYTREHPELMVVTRRGEPTDLIHMLKSFPDGTPFETVFIKKLKEVIADYALDGIQLADGVSSPRMALQDADYSPEITGRFFEETGIAPSNDLSDIPATADYIFGSYRREWIEFYTRHWGEFMAHVIAAIRECGAKAAFNSAWTKGPVEAIYRYGADYKAYQDAGADSFIVEDVAADLFFLSHSDNGFEMGVERRKFIHYEFAANMMELRANLPELKLTPLCMIRDTLEQWDVLHHMPTAMQRAVAVNLNNYYVERDGSFRPVTNGPHYCLGDGLKATDWDLLRMMWDNAFTQGVTDVSGVTVVWSDKTCTRELSELIDRRLWYTGKWIAELLSKGGAVHKITRVENLEGVRGPILVINPALFDGDDRAAIGAYTGGEILYLGLADDGKIRFTGLPERALEAVPLHHVTDPNQAIWTDSLTFMEVEPAFVEEVARYINDLAELPAITGDYGACHVNQVMTGPNTARLFIDNQEFYYATPWIKPKRKIKSLYYVTKPECYPIHRREDGAFSIRIPGFGMDIVEVTYEEE